ncbi:hypothetical protein GCM10025882_13900 [Acinetobacter gyllenbergii]|uniref:DUF190 domain-containing protein n=1 Tax=Acinetobacter gyllenbergii CIP 110306 = MTCC 11365 TaxID=1217657 RepID=A0A829HDH1_9GAMM|nr:DUF190 domain-containing protein [Acinetobacter gyllenbergii]EPF75878.1 hypothetical protein F957_03001 [Acinetobacter gyllenbergii CIP 110306 = MTCC 11365]EPH32010.1 hypothetical protein L293_1786 [Acinetobacter gyllenbergii CIP 110306 = MTCC 11365]ESK39340.1 hypothetical protein F987_02706 [Acinetobacter gyllenbergii NIPH 230]GMA10965.1 hypothetical protein GCM10025882_13900 [Acinetobacter gyllenbergii]
MNGFLLSFYTAQNRAYQGQQMSEWLLAVAKQMNLRGATVLAGLEGVDHQGLFHSASFFELADRPVQIQFAVTDEQATELMNYLNDKEISLFYVKTPIEFGVVGQVKPDS